MKLDTYLDKLIEKKFEARNKLESDNHKSSGKLSASMLGEPLQWQILKMKGIKPREFDEYTLRKFFRGKEVEKWLIEEMPNIVDKQKFVEYRDCIGYVDAIIDTKDFDFKLGIIPHEIKSVSNAKFKRVNKEGADRGHKLQAALYALALGKDNFAIDYVATDDLRVNTFIYETNDFKEEIDNIIDTFYKTLKSGEIPKFEPREKWQENLKYCKYPDYVNYGKEEINFGEPDSELINKDY